MSEGPVDWVAWHNETIDALAEAVEAAPVAWGTNAETGEPFVVVGDHTISGLEFPAAFIPEYESRLSLDESDLDEELHEVDVTVWLVAEADVREREANLRAALELAAEVQTHLYANRTLDRAVRTLFVMSVTPTAAVVDGSTIHAAELEVRIYKNALVT